MTYWVDLHLHSVLSPCADVEMGAREIVERVREEGVSLIALTDHNHIGNFPALRDAAEGNPVVLCGMEVQSMEDIHIVVIFPNYDVAIGYKEWLWEEMPPIKNKEDKFGYQLIVDKDGEVLDQEEILLIQGVQRSVDEIAIEAKARGCIVIMAHIDRPAFSYEAALGRLPDDFPCDAVELSPNVSHAQLDEWKKKYPTRAFVRSSDSHRLSGISRSSCTPLELSELSFEGIRRALL